MYTQLATKSGTYSGSCTTVVVVTVWVDTGHFMSACIMWAFAAVSSWMPLHFHSSSLPYMSHYCSSSTLTAFHFFSLQWIICSTDLHRSTDTTCNTQHPVFHFSPFPLLHLSSLSSLLLYSLLVMRMQQPTYTNGYRSIPRFYSSTGGYFLRLSPFALRLASSLSFFLSLSLFHAECTCVVREICPFFLAFTYMAKIPTATTGVNINDTNNDKTTTTKTQQQLQQWKWWT